MNNKTGKILRYIVIFYYMDGETVEVELHSDDMDAFMKTLNAGEVYFNDTRGVGVWISIDKVRHFQVEKVDEEGKRVVGGGKEIPDSEGRAADEGAGGVGRAVFVTEAESESVEAVL